MTGYAKSGCGIFKMYLISAQVLLHHTVDIIFGPVI